VAERQTACMKNKIKEFWPYLLVVLAIVLPWFFNSGYLFFTDMVWGPKITLDWTSSLFLLNLVIKGLSFVISIVFLEKIFISGVLLLILLGGRKIVKVILGANASNWLIFILSLFALFNPFVYDRALYGQTGVLAAYGFSLFVIAYLIEAYKNLNLKKLYLVAIFSGLTILFAVHFIFFLAPFCILFLLGIVLKFTHPVRDARTPLPALPAGRLLEGIKIFIFSAIIVIAINANWLIAIATHNSATASFVQQGISQQDLIAFQTSGNGALGTFKNVLLMSGFWGKDQFRYLDLTKVSGWQKSFILLLPIILYGVYLNFRRRSKNEKILSTGLIIIFIIAIILAVGIKAPIAREITLYLYNHFPLYKGLREPQKWVAVIIPIYLIFLTLGVAKIKEWKFIKNNLGWSALVLAVIIIMQAPSLLWGFNRQVSPTSYPSDWQEVDKFLLNNSAQSYSCSDKIIFLPWHMYMSFGWSGKIMANPAQNFFSCPVVSGSNMEWGNIYDNSGDAESQKIENWIASNGKNNIPETRYIILAKEVDWQKYLWLNNLDYLKLVKETNSLIVYKVIK